MALSLSSLAAGNDPLIRVRLSEGESAVAVRGQDLRFNGMDAGGGAEWLLRCQDDRIRAVERNSGRALDLHAPAVVESPVGFLSFRGRPYREKLIVHSDGSLCEVVNELDIERYLVGLVNAEFNSRWNEEAIAAQVVAARSYALYQIREARRRGQSYDVDASVNDQVYDGSIREDARSVRIVERTRGLALVVGNAPLKAFYHSTCAGHTEVPQNVWGKPFPGYRRGVVCPYCAHSPVLNWKMSLTLEQLQRTVRQGAFADGTLPPLVRKATLQEIRVQRFDAEGRVAEVLTRWRTPIGMITDFRFTGAQLRDWIGPSKFRSASFNLTLIDSEVRFTGRGNGHGVGLCQYGAKEMGEEGYTMAQILKHYYPDVRLQKVSDTILLRTASN